MPVKERGLVREKETDRWAWVILSALDCEKCNLQMQLQLQQSKSSQMTHNKGKLATVQARNEPKT